ncbi:MAG: hypothetical protein ERJ69_08385 [Aphanocapsa feldmannii 288cV]|nr:MAG: hypothetical protein ERJ69_08385 [Aphanocapsa feldmannii 288cV]
MPVPPEEPCQCADCQRFYRAHDRLIRENPTLRQQQEMSWAAIQSFRTLAGRVLEELQKKQGDQPRNGESDATATLGDDDAERMAAELENINAHLFSIEVLLERVFDVKLPEQVEDTFKEVAGELAPDPLNPDRLRLNRLLHQTPDLPN